VRFSGCQTNEKGFRNIVSGAFFFAALSCRNAINWRRLIVPAAPGHRIAEAFAATGGLFRGNPSDFWQGLKIWPDQTLPRRSTVPAWVAGIP